MNLITLFNPTDKDILNYPIEEIEFDLNGQPILDQFGSAKRTGRTLEWTLKAGETLKFPDYVANYLKGIYGFLEVTGEEAPQPTETNPETREPIVPKEMAKPEEGGVNCKTCGKSFRNLKGLALHVAHTHPKQLLGK